MATSITQKEHQKIKDFLINSNSRERRYFFKWKENDHFEDKLIKYQYWRYFYGTTINYARADFHHKMDELLNEAMIRKERQVGICGFRECGKTEEVRNALAYMMLELPELSNLIYYTSYTKSNAIATARALRSLLSYQTIARDYGEMFDTEKQKELLRDGMVKKIDRTSSFILKNGVFFDAMTTAQLNRGRSESTNIFTGSSRVKVFVIDDFETLSTFSEAKSQSIMDSIEEGKTSLDQSRGIFISLFNYIKKGYIVENIMEDPNIKKIQIDILDQKGRPNWPDKYVMKEIEAVKLNDKIAEEGKKKVSIQRLKETYGTRFNAELMNLPESDDTLFFGELNLKQGKLLRTIEGIRIYREFDKNKIYYIGADPAGGKGRDKSACVVYDPLDNEVVAVFSSNTIKIPDFALKIKKMSDMYDDGLTNPEVNEGLGTYLLDELLKLEVNIYKRIRTDKIKFAETGSYGTITTESSKNGYLTKLRDRVMGIEKEGIMKVNDPELIKDLQTYSIAKDKVRDKRGHKDTMIALALGVLVSERESIRGDIIS